MCPNIKFRYIVPLSIESGPELLGIFAVYKEVRVIIIHTTVCVYSQPYDANVEF